MVRRCPATRRNQYRGRRRPERKGRIGTFGRALQQFGRRALVNLIALMGNYAGTAALLTVFDMQLDPDQPLPLAATLTAFGKRAEDPMFERLEQTRSLTANQMRNRCRRDSRHMLEFFDYFLIGFVLAFIVVPWKLSFGQSAIILLSSGIGAILGAAIWGRLADRIGRRAVFIGTVLNFSIATGILALTPDEGWIFLTAVSRFRRVRRRRALLRRSSVSSGICPGVTAGLYRGLVTAFIPIGVMIGSVLGAFLTPVIGWRGLFACGLVPALLALLIRAWVPEITALASADGPARGSAALACLGAEGAPGIVAIAAN